MVNNPRLPTLDLDVQKDVRFIVRPFKLTQGDKGYVQPFRLTNAWSQYNISATNLAFHATKPDGTVIEIENEPTRFSQENGVWLFTLPEQIAQAIGNATCYFSVVEGDNLVASTTKFGYEVSAKFGTEIPSNNYVSALEDMEKQFQDYLANANTQLNKQNQLTNESKQQLTQTLADMSKKTQDWLTTKTAEVDADIKTRQDNLNALNSQYQAKYNELVASWNSKITSIQSDWEARKAEILAQAKNQRDSISTDWDTLKAKFNVDRDTAIRTANDNFQTKLAEIQTDWNAEKTKLEKGIADYKKVLEEKLKPVADKVTDLLENKLPDLNGKADAVQAKVDQLKADFNAIDFSSYAKNSEVAVARAVPYPIGVTDLDQLPEGRYNTRNLTADQWQTIAHIPPIDQYGMIICYREDSDGWQLAYSTNNPSIIFYRGAGGGKYTDWQQIKQPSSTYSNKDIDDKIAANKPDWTKLTNKPKYRYSLFNGNIHFNEASGNFELFTKNYTSNEVSDSGTMAIDLDDDAELQRTARALNDIKNRAYNSLPLDGGGMHKRSVISWNGGDINDRSGNLGGLTWTGGTDNAKIYGDQNGNDNLDLVIDLGDDNSNHISFRWNGAEKAAIDSGGKFTGRINWDHIDGRPDTNSLQQQINQIKSTMPDIHVVNSEAEGNTYLASHPNAIIMVKG
ncbi:BppU family phage baseplate upper protein [uncultured Lactobacillus sp.]|uniref:BppU family phage baseplate upper protein n=1 Tax=uncultured Lactobacillus sp. TaxID=153152 RepID=UPI00262CA4E5|nr:BppU family phage baseplate upper protein [uncultured Lactobacillus sp.]